MPFAVSQWPYSPDPRGPEFGGYGWAFGAVPSYQWIVSTTGAGGPWTSLNDGILVTSIFDVDNFGSYEGFDLGETVKASILRFSFQPPQPGPVSINLGIDLISLVLPRQADASQAYEYPFAIQEFDGFQMQQAGGGGPDPDLPNPVKITPAVWDLQPAEVNLGCKL